MHAIRLDKMGWDLGCECLREGDWLVHSPICLWQNKTRGRWKWLVCQSVCEPVFYRSICMQVMMTLSSHLKFSLIQRLSNAHTPSSAQAIAFQSPRPAPSIFFSSSIFFHAATLQFPPPRTFPHLSVFAPPPLLISPPAFFFLPSSSFRDAVFHLSLACLIGVNIAGYCRHLTM